MTLCPALLKQHARERVRGALVRLLGVATDNHVMSFVNLMIYIFVVAHLMGCIWYSVVYAGVIEPAGGGTLFYSTGYYAKKHSLIITRIFGDYDSYAKPGFLATTAGPAPVLGAAGASGAGLAREGESTLFCPSHEKFHVGLQVVRNLPNISL